MTHVTVVGVMREGFEFPVAHDVWTPLRAEMLNQALRSGPGVTIFGVLASGRGRTEISNRREWLDA